jgi:DNA-binding MarR family transcriptional regulator
VRESAAEQSANHCVGELLEQSTDLLVRFLMDRAELSTSAGFAMNRVCREGPIRLTALAAKEGVTQPAMTGLVQRLERQGLLTRLADPADGRAALIGITSKGGALLDERRRLRQERLARLLATLTPEEESVLWLAARVAAPVLQRLAAIADCADDGVAPLPDPVESGAAPPLTKQA